jgi:transcriptional regulator of acetoin/glycerol metabolism
VIAASSCSLAADVKESRFRLDLFHHLSVARLVIPPLRDRMTDLVPLIDTLLHQIKRNEAHSLRIASEVLSRMTDYRWPGNIRELRNVLSCMAASSPDGALQCADLPTSFATSPLHRESVDVSSDLRTIERRTILAAIDKAGGRRTAAARALGISKATIYRKLAAFRNNNQNLPESLTPKVRGIPG